MKTFNLGYAYPSFTAPDASGYRQPSSANKSVGEEVQAVDHAAAVKHYQELYPEIPLDDTGYWKDVENNHTYYVAQIMR